MGGAFRWVCDDESEGERRFSLTISQAVAAMRVWGVLKAFLSYNLE